MEFANNHTSDSESDIWESDDDCFGNSVIMNKRLPIEGESRIWNDGYRQGRQFASATVMQTGFDLGLESGIEFGIELGKLFAFAVSRNDEVANSKLRIIIKDLKESVTEQYIDRIQQVLLDHSMYESDVVEIIASMRLMINKTLHKTQDISSS